MITSSVHSSFPYRSKKKIAGLTGNVALCPFCDLPRFKAKYEFINAIPKTLLSYSRKILYRNDYFYVIPDISPISEYHLLIISKQHYTSMKSIPPRMMRSLNQTKAYVEQVLKQVTKDNVIYFEHGTCLVTESACIAHAHLHCLPLSKEHIERLFQSILKVEEEADGEDIVDNYMYMELKKGLSFTWADTFKKKQFLRDLLAKVLEVPNRTSWQYSLGIDQERSVTETWLATTVQLFQDNPSKL